MSATSSIEWTATVHPDGSVTPGKTWNPVTGCTKVSAGCKNCYAEGIAKRLWATSYPVIVEKVEGTLVGRPRRFEDVQCHEDRLLEPLSWRKPARVFVNSMSDLFHEDVPDEFIDKVFAVMALAPQHTFQILTKRPERMRAYMTSTDRRDQIHRGWQLTEAATRKRLEEKQVPAWPLPNVWLGVSVENQHFADERVRLLLKTPAAVRFVSAEPLLGPVLFDDGDHSYLTCTSKLTMDEYEAMTAEQRQHIDEVAGSCCESWDQGFGHYHGIDWVIVGGESGPGARPFDLAWARSIVQQCKAAGVPVFYKQGGSQHRCEHSSKGGCLDCAPPELRVREFPHAS